jgi:putative transposase
MPELEPVGRGNPDSHPELGLRTIRRCCSCSGYYSAYSLTRLLVLPGANGGVKDLDILVLRHQLGVLRRKTGRPRFTMLDRIVLAAASRVLPRDRWASFLVTPQTLLRWHRMLVRSK